MNDEESGHLLNVLKKGVFSNKNKVDTKEIDLSVHQTYDKVLDYLSSVGAQVIHSEKPTTVVASHGKWITWEPRDSKKEINIRIAEIEPNRSRVSVHIKRSRIDKAIEYVLYFIMFLTTLLSFKINIGLGMIITVFFSLTLGAFIVFSLGEKEAIARGLWLYFSSRDGAYRTRMTALKRNNTVMTSKFVDTSETSLRISILLLFLAGLFGYMGYHICFELLQSLYANEWTFSVFLDMTIRDFLPISLAVGSFAFGVKLKKRKYKVLPLSEYSPKTDVMTMELASNLGVKPANLYLSPIEKPNALTFGRIRGNANLVFTLGLIRLLKEYPAEMRSVICHELCHILHRDVALITWADTFSTALKYWFPLLLTYELYFNFSRGGRTDFLLIRILFISAFFLIVPHFLVNSISRKREYLADAHTSILMKSTAPLENALLKIGVYQGKIRSGYRLEIAGSSNRWLGSYPFLLDRLSSLREKKYVGKGAGIPSLEACGWMGIISAMFIGLVLEIIQGLFGEEQYLIYYGWPWPWWLHGLVDAYEWIGRYMGSVLICIFFAAGIWRYLARFSPQHTFVPDDMIIYFKQAWKNIVLCTLVFSIVFVPWHLLLEGNRFLLAWVPRLENIYLPMEVYSVSFLLTGIIGFCLLTIILTPLLILLAFGLLTILYHIIVWNVPVRSLFGESKYEERG